MKGMCHQCYSIKVELVLTEVEGTIDNPTGISEIPLCDKCRD